ncbi:MAG TPA: T9SS type A sorting domain-containing protein [Bacteroidales bacterium]|nr:T9SS type A sorting domain-containing protein [Bacteroidales bacterium]
MKKILLIIIALIIGGVAYSQTISSYVVASAGESAENGNISISWTLGEVAVETLESSSITLTQGFQQGYFEITSIDESITGNITLKVYPNPAAEFIWVAMETVDIKVATIEIFDIDGKRVYNQKWHLIDGEKQILLNGFSASQYILRVSDETGKVLQNLKLIKR